MRRNVLFSSSDELLRTCRGRALRELPQRLPTQRFEGDGGRGGKDCDPSRPRLPAVGPQAIRIRNTAGAVAQRPPVRQSQVEPLRAARFWLVSYGPCRIEPATLGLREAARDLGGPRPGWK
jgi:hypothetical protein